MSRSLLDQLQEQFHDDVLEFLDGYLQQVARVPLKFPDDIAQEARLVDADLGQLFRALDVVFDASMTRLRPTLLLDLEKQPARDTR